MINRIAPGEQRTILLLAIAAFASAASLRVCDPLLPALAQAFDTSTGSAAATITAFALAYGVLQLVYGGLGDRYGKFRVIAWATLACAIGSIGAALAPSLAWLVFFRVISGATAAGIIPLSMAWIGDTVPYETRQATLARLISGVILGMIGGAVLGGVFVDLVGWRWLFVVLAVVYVAVGSLLYSAVRRCDEARLRAGTAASRPSLRFVAQMRAVLRVRWARVVIGAAMVEGLLIFGALSFVPAFLHERFNVPLSAAGAILGTYGVGGLVYTAAAKRLVTRLGEVRLAAAGGLVMSVAFLLLLAAPAWPWTVPACFLVGAGFYLLHGTLQTHATQMVPHARGTAVSLFAGALFVGQSIGVTAGAWILDYAGIGWLLGIASIGLALVGLGFALLLKRRLPPPIAGNQCACTDS
ncbi:MAG TPA: MFS transporter [Burkholderiaceae bacterium]|nr:MFS transporter [Burkholderiaceae bacterium]